MNARSILTTLFRNNSSDHRQKRRRNLRQPTAAETLEQRTLLTTYVVEGPEHVSANIVERADNSGSLSARSLLAAIEHANANPGPDTIRFSEFFDDPQTIVLVKPSESVGEEIVITGDLTIVGPGADKLLITGDGFGANDADGNDFGDLFEVGPFATVEIFGVQLAGGFNGAVIRNEGFLTLDNVHVTDSSSTAIQNFGTLHVQDSTFTRIDGGQGGGIGSFDGTVNVENSLFTDSYSLLGGALYAENTDLTVVNSTFSGNTANLDGGAISITGGTTRLTNNTIVNNHVLVDSVGGGIVFNDEVAANQSHLANNIIAGNTREFSTDTDILVEPNDIDFFAGGTLSSSNRNNLIGDPNSAGGLVHGANGNILGDGDGGLLDLDGVLDVTLRDLGGPTPVHPLVVDSPAIDAGDNSEAIGLDGGPMLSDQRGYPHRRIVNETITQTAQVDIGAYEVQDVVSRPSPDAIVVSIIDDESDGNFAPDDLSLREAVELANRSLDHNTIFFNEDVRGTIDLNERPLFIGGGLTINGPGERPVDLSGFSEPERQNILNSTLTIDGGDQNHLLHIYNNAEAKVSRLTLLNGNGGQFSGGAIVNNGSLLAEDLVVGESSALTGGGIFNGPTATLDIRRSTIEGNSATLTTSSGVGGGIENQGYLKLEEVFITNNQATQGGGVSSESGNESFPAVTTIIGSVFEGNAGRDVSTLASSGRGGGFRNQGGVATVIESAFLRNRASSGAGIYSSGGPIEVIHSDISHNAAQQFGGGAEIQSPDHHSTIFGSTFANNTGGSGGGVALNVHPDGAGGGSITLSNSTVSQNHTGTFGGGVAVEGNAPGAEVRIRDTTIAFNESDLGGGLANNGALTELDNTILSNNIGRNRGAEYVELFFGNLPNVPRHIVVQDYVAAEWTNSTALEDGDNRNLLGVDPKLVPILATVPGSFTATHTLQVDSPAIDAGSSDRLVDQAGQRALGVPNRQNEAVFIQVPENKHSLPLAEPLSSRMAIDELTITIDGVTFRMTSIPGQSFSGEETIFVSLPTNWVSGGYDATEHKRVADLIVDAINNHPSLDHVAAVVRGDVANGLDAQLDSWFTPFWGWNELLLSGAAPGTNPRVNHHPLFIEIIGANSVSSSTDPENTPDGHPGDYESVIERGNRAELYPTGIADIGAFEAQISVIEDDWTSEVIGHSQFGNSGSPAQVGLGYTVPRSTTIPTEPGFLGFDFNPDPFTFGGIGEGWFGDKYGGEVRADIASRRGSNTATTPTRALWMFIMTACQLGNQRPGRRQRSDDQHASRNHGRQSVHDFTSLRSIR